MARSGAVRHEPLPAFEAGVRTLPTWRSVFAGAVIGVAMMFVLGALWFAIAYGSGVETVRENLDWYLGGTAIFSLFVAGFAAGNLSGLRGTGAGSFTARWCGRWLRSPP